MDNLETTPEAQVPLCPWKTALCSSRLSSLPVLHSGSSHLLLIIEAYLRSSLLASGGVNVVSGSNRTVSSVISEQKLDKVLSTGTTLVKLKTLSVVVST